MTKPNEIFCIVLETYLWKEGLRYPTYPALSGTFPVLALEAPCPGKPLRLRQTETVGYYKRASI